MMISQEKTALIVGASGLVGRVLLKELCNASSYRRVVALVRRPLEEATQEQYIKQSLAEGRLVQKIIDFKADIDNLGHLQGIGQVHDVFCTLGTTMRAAGSVAAFRKVDYEYPLRVAEAALRHGAEQYCLVSSIGANARSAVLYSRVKGEVENAINALIGYKTVVVMRPSVLVGKRKEARMGEEFAAGILRLLEFIMIGAFKKYRAIGADVVAFAMMYEVSRNKVGRRVLESDEIQEIFEAFASSRAVSGR